MEKYLHYGQEVIFTTNTKEYEIILAGNGVSFESLPILSKDWRALKYNDKYAVCQTHNTLDGLWENVFVFTRMPDDLCLDTLIQDVLGQKEGAEPLKMRSKAKKLIAEAEVVTQEQYANADITEELMMDPKEKYSRSLEDTAFYIQSNYAYSRKYFELLPHEDVDAEYWHDLIEKFV